MTHTTQQDFCRRVVQLVPEGFRDCRVLEFGSYNVNGSVREFFEDCEHIGVDWREGPDVDVVSLFHEYEDPEPFDTFISVNTFEHDPHWQVSIARGVSLLRPGGLVVICAGRNHGPHEMDCPPEPRHYKNVTPSEMAPVLDQAGVSGLFIDDNPECEDTRFVGRKR